MFYRPGLPQRAELEYASRQLATIEINGTCCGAQKPAVYAAWARQVPDGFVFSLRAPRHCTGARQLARAGSSINGFVHGGLAELGDRLGPLLWQFPPQRAFNPDDFAAFLERLPRGLDGRRLRHVIEVRHPGVCRSGLAGAGAAVRGGDRVHGFAGSSIVCGRHRRFHLRPADAQP